MERQRKLPLSLWRRWISFVVWLFTSDNQIASVLNRRGYSTGKGKRWNQTRVAAARRNHAIAAQLHAEVLPWPPDPITDDLDYTLRRHQANPSDRAAVKESVPLGSRT